MQSLLVLTWLMLSGLLTVPIKGTSTTGVTKVLQQLNDKYNINLNVFINLEDITRDSLDLQQVKTPAIHIKSSIKTFINFRLLGTFSEKSLIIVNIKKSQFGSLISRLLPHLLKDLNELHIVFLTEENPKSWQDNLFTNCFKEGFINTLLIHHTNQTMSFSSYNPYPTNRAMRLSHLEDYLNRWKLLRNLQHYEIRTLIYQIEPRMMEYTNRKGQVVYAGYMYNVMKEFIRLHNATIKHLPVTFELQSFIPLINSKKIDYFCYPKELRWKLTYTKPLYILKAYLIVPHARPLPSYLYFARPFNSTLWLTVIAAGLYIMLMLYISDGSDRSEIGGYFLRTLCHLIFLPQPRIRVNNWQQFVINFILILSGFILSTLYLSLLRSMFTSGLFESQINSLKDLQHAPYQLLLANYYAKFLKESTSLPDSVLNNAHLVDRRTMDSSRDNLNTTYMHLAYKDRLEGILYQQHLLKVPRFKKISESIMDGLMAFPVAPSLPYLNMLNVYLRRIFEGGILEKMKKDAWRDTIESGVYKLMRNDGTESIQLDLTLYRLPFIMWAVGLALAGLSFVLELLRGRKF